MRIQSLDLVRYGKFTDQTVDFGARPLGGPDLHIIYGPNEAGKSTIFAAWLDLLYGIETRSPYSFLHPYETMKIGATIELAGVSQSLARIKKPSGSLLDSRDQPLAEGVILNAMSGLDRESYRTMFSLDDDTLEKGGETILASKGDLGQLLFSASAGLSDLAERLAAIETETDNFHKKRGRSTELAEFKKRLDELKTERDRINVLASDHARLMANQLQAKAAFDEANGQRGHMKAKLASLQRDLGLLPRQIRLGSLRQMLAEMEEFPVVPDHWRSDLPALRKRQIELSMALIQARGDHAAICQAIEDNLPDEVAASHAQRIAELAILEARSLTEQADLSRRQLELRETDAVINMILNRLGRNGEPDPGRLLLPVAVTGALRGLMTSFSGIAARLGASEREVQTSKAKIAEIENAILDSGAASDLTPDPFKITALTDALTQASASNFTDRLTLARRTLRAANDGFSARLAALKPWSGDGEQLVTLGVPVRETIQTLRSQLEKAASSAEKHHETVTRLESEIRTAQAERDHMAALPGLIDDEAVRSTRSRRDKAWMLHKQALERETAEHFETILHEDDLLNTSRLGQMAEAANLRQLDQRLARLATELEIAQNARATETAALDAKRAELGKRITAISSALPIDMTPVELDGWLVRHGAAMEALALLQAAERDADAASQDVETVRLKLDGALVAIGVQTADRALEDLMALARQLIERQKEFSQLKKAAADGRRELSGRERDFEEARAAVSAWKDAWADACAQCWLSKNGDIPDLAVMAEILKELEALGPALNNRAALADRIGKMEKDINDFAQAMKQLAADFSVDAEAEPHGLYRLLLDRVRQAQEADAKRVTDREEQLARRRRLDDITMQLAEITRQVEAMTGLFAVDNLDAVEAKLNLIDKRKGLEAEITAISEEISTALGAAEIADAETRLAGIDRAALETEIATLLPASEEMDTRCQELFSAFTKARDNLDAIRGDDDVARLEEQRKTVLLEIEEGAQKYMRLKLGALATETALRLYRDQHRSSMMDRASAAFRIMSRGQYSGLATQPDGNHELLIAIGADGSSKAANQLSKGTRFQLYLALRVAGYHEYAASRNPVPFIADDIMETFDDFRAEEAFGLFASMAETGQVIYLTHHRHLCEIARKVCPSVSVHEIG